MLRTSMIPVVTFFGADLGALMGGAIVTEGIFNVNGVGLTLYRAALNGDGSMVVPIVTFPILIFASPTCWWISCTRGSTQPARSVSRALVR